RPGRGGGFLQCEEARVGAAARAGAHLHPLFDRQPAHLSLRLDPRAQGAIEPAWRLVRYLDRGIVDDGPRHRRLSAARARLTAADAWRQTKPSGCKMLYSAGGGGVSTVRAGTTLAMAGSGSERHHAQQRTARSPSPGTTVAIAVTGSAKRPASRPPTRPPPICRKPPSAAAAPAICGKGAREAV